MKIPELVRKMLIIASRGVYVPPSLRGYYKTKSTPVGTRLDETHYNENRTGNPRKD